jgi:hypothetical protein
MLIPEQFYTSPEPFDLIVRCRRHQMPTMWIWCGSRWIIGAHTPQFQDDPLDDYAKPFADKMGVRLPQL